MNEIHYNKYLKYKNKYLNIVRNTNLIYIDGGGACKLSMNKYFKFELKINENTKNSYEILLNDEYNTIIIKENNNIKYELILDMKINIYMAMNITFSLLQKEYKNVNIVITNNKDKKYTITSNDKTNDNAINFTSNDSFLNFYKNALDCDIDDVFINITDRNKINNLLLLIVANTQINSHASSTTHKITKPMAQSQIEPTPVTTSVESTPMAIPPAKLSTVPPVESSIKSIVKVPVELPMQLLMAIHPSKLLMDSSVEPIVKSMEVPVESPIPMPISLAKMSINSPVKSPTEQISRSQIELIPIQP